MKTITPSSCTLAQNGSNLGDDNGSPSTCPPIDAPRIFRFLTACSSCSHGHLPARHPARSKPGILHEIPHFGDQAVSMHVHDFHAAPANENFPPLAGSGRSALKGGPGKRSSRQQHSGRSARHGLQEIPAISHASLHSIFPAMRQHFISPLPGSTEKILFSL